MPDYSIYGGCLRSDISFPELRETSGNGAAWTFRTSTTAPPLSNAECLGEAELSATLRLRLFKHSHGFRLQYDDTGTYDISADGREIVWCPGPEPRPSDVRSDVMGRALAVALHASGLLCLHASAVAFPAGTVAFVAPKYHGKSTLALALARTGAGKLVTDDVLPVDLGPPVEACPGVHQVRLWDDTAELFGIERQPVGPGEKQLVREFPDGVLMTKRTPLAAIYLLGLAPDDGADREAAQRERLSDIASALVLVRQIALASILRGSEATVLFERAVMLARQVPVYRLDRVKGLDRMNEVIERILDWHGGPYVRPAATGASV